MQYLQFHTISLWLAVGLLKKDFSNIVLRGEVFEDDSILKAQIHWFRQVACFYFSSTISFCVWMCEGNILMDYNF